MSTRFPIVAALGLALAGPIAVAVSRDGPAGEAGSGAVPAALEPYAGLVGRWKGQAVPADEPLRGWREAHEWAWAFEDGEPVGLTLTVEGGKVLRSGRLSYDPDARVYRLEGSDPMGESVVFAGPRDPKTNALTLDRSGPMGEDRLTIRPNANGIRAEVWFDRKGPGAPQYARLIRANLGKEGVNFAAGGAASSGPQCVVTGGAASIVVSAGGSTFSVCCSGCRDEVVANPEKYAAKLKAVSASRAGAPKAPRTGPDEFGRPSPDPDPTPSSDPAPAPGAEPAGEPGPEPSPAPADAELRRKAASWLRIGHALETQGKADGALGFYRRVVSEAPETPEAETARDRIEAIEGDG